VSPHRQLRSRASDHSEERSFVDELIEEHEQIHVLFDALVVAAEDDKHRLLRELVGAIVKHEVAEQVVVYPAARRAGATGRRIVESRLEEQFELDAKLHRLEQLDIGSEAFDTLLLDVERDVHLHTTYEERTLLEPLRMAVSPEQLVAIAKQYQVVRFAAPSHPYPDGDESQNSTRARVRGGLLRLLRGMRDSSSRRQGEGG